MIELADKARRKYRLNVTVNDILEQHATAEQKRRKIDLADFLFEGHTENTESTEIVHDAKPFCDFSDFCVRQNHAVYAS